MRDGRSTRVRVMETASACMVEGVHTWVMKTVAACVMDGLFGLSPPGKVRPPRPSDDLFGPSWIGRPSPSGYHPVDIYIYWII